MLFTKEMLDQDEMRALLEETLLEMNNRLAEKIGDNQTDKPIRLSLSMSAKGENRVTAAICMCQVSPGVFRPKKCKSDGTCP